VAQGPTLGPVACRLSHTALADLPAAVSRVARGHDSNKHDDMLPTVSRPLFLGPTTHHHSPLTTHTRHSLTTHSLTLTLTHTHTHHPYPDAYRLLPLSRLPYRKNTRGNLHHMH
jgi:hypothetical protein